MIRKRYILAAICFSNLVKLNSLVPVPNVIAVLRTSGLVANPAFSLVSLLQLDY